ncbi:MAG: SOS response-associated peptidase [Ignavibacteria bacterium]|nr:SOS response-associated peptidase [Ignavibacteria bacterium]
MCGRFESKKIDKAVIEMLKKKKLKVEIDKEVEKRIEEDIRPTQKILSITLNKETYFLSNVNWGIKFSENSPLIFNSRIETIKEKKYWNTLFSRNKCIVPMTGFYEWKKEGEKKVKYRIFLPDEDIFFVPAIYHQDKAKNIFTSLITTVPNKFIKAIHHRMPIIFNLDNAVGFLNDDVETNLNRCVPYSDSKKMDFELAVN